MNCTYTQTYGVGGETEKDRQINNNNGNTQGRESRAGILARQTGIVMVSVVYLKG